MDAKMYTLFNKIAMLACDEWRPTSEEGDEWWVGASYEDKEYDINLFVGHTGEICATVYPVIDGMTKTDDDRLIMKLW